jgi:hypothetical protein
MRLAMTEDKRKYIMSEDEMIAKIAGKLNKEELDYFMDELVGYPRPIDAGKDASKAEDDSQEITDIIEKKWGSGPETDASKFSKAYAKFLQNHPNLLNTDQAWREEIERRWPDDKELQSIYRNKQAQQPVYPPPPTSAKQLYPSETKYSHYPPRYVRRKYVSYT